MSVFPQTLASAPLAAKPLCGMGTGASAASTPQTPGRAPPGLTLLDTCSEGGGADGCTAGNIPGPRPAAHAAKRQKEPGCTDTGNRQHRSQLHGAQPGSGTPLRSICRCQGAKRGRAELAGPFCCVPRAPDPRADGSPPARAAVASKTERRACLLTF